MDQTISTECTLAGFKWLGSVRSCHIGFGLEVVISVQSGSYQRLSGTLSSTKATADGSFRISRQCATLLPVYCDHGTALLLRHTLLVSTLIIRNHSFTTHNLGGKYDFLLFLVPVLQYMYKSCFFKSSSRGKLRQK